MNKDLMNCKLYLVNGIIVDFIDYNKRLPTIKEVKDNFNFALANCGLYVSDNKIQEIINKVNTFYNL